MLSHNQWKKRYPGLVNSKKQYYLYRHIMNDLEAAEKVLYLMKEFGRMKYVRTLAPTTTCTNSTVLCGPDPALYDTENYDWFKGPDGWTPKLKGNNPMFLDVYDCPAVKSTPKNAAGAGSVASVVLNAAPDTEQDQRKYLEQRAYNVRYLKRDELDKQFFISEPDGPKTPQELIDRLKAGLYTVDTKDSDGDEFEEGDYFYWRDAFSWRTPTTQPDKASYKAATEAFEKVYQDTVDTIKIASPADGLVALKALQDWQFTKK